MNVEYNFIFTMGRKRNQGKARKAAKAKAREEATESNNQVTNQQRQSLADRLQTGNSNSTKCYHGFEKMNKISRDITANFVEAFHACFQRGSNSVFNSLVTAENATMEEFAEVWTDSSKLKSVVSFFLSVGAQHILDDDYDHARDCATFARYFEQYIAVKLDQTQAIMNWPKLFEAYRGDIHTLVKFYRRRIPCSCLDEKYDEVKCITKVGICYNPDCRLTPSGEVDRSKTMYCSRCRSVTYCSRECQKADWAVHRPSCDECVV